MYCWPNGRIRSLISLAMTSTLLISCGSKPTASDISQLEKVKLVRQIPEWQAGDELKIEAEVAGFPSQPTISGATNLPDGTELNVSVSHGDRVFGGNDFSVANGAFSVNIIGRGDSLLPGRYDVEIGSALVEFQPNGLRYKFGRDYENLTGPYFEDGASGRTIRWKQQHTVPGVLTSGDRAAAEKKRADKLREFAENTCIQQRSDRGEATKTPKAQLELVRCTESLVRDILAD